MLKVTFKSKGRSGRVWEEDFDCGSEEADAKAALEVAWKMRATIERTNILSDAAEFAYQRMMVGITKQSTADCDWYESIECDACLEVAQEMGWADQQGMDYLEYARGAVEIGEPPLYPDQWIEANAA